MDSQSPTGVRISSDFRDNLIIDRYDPVFANMRATKLKHLRSENSEDAVTWNVFRSLRQIDPGHWLPDLSERAFGGLRLAPERASVALWVAAAPPPALLASGDEGDSEIDVVLEGPTWVWFIEAKYRSDISAGTTVRPARDQAIRNIDVGSYYAGVRDFYFSLLVASETRSPAGAAAIRRYSDLSTARSELGGHRPDGVTNLRGVSLMTWAHLGAVLLSAASGAERLDERGYAERAVSWLAGKNLVPISSQASAV